MEVPTAGIHHVSSIAGDPQRNLDFYAGVLGLRLVKLTVNYDDPGTYHLYYGNERGDPGSILTYFPWGREAASGRVGIGQVAVTSLSIIPRAIAYWVGRLIAKGVKYEGPLRRFDDQLLSFRDPDGNQIELVGHGSADTRQGWSDGPVPADSAIRGIHSVTLLEAGLDPVGHVLSTVLGFRQTQSDDTRFRFEAPGDSASIVDVRAAGEFWSGTMGPGTVHHVAFRARTAPEQERTRDEVMRSGLAVTPVLDRKYFRSIYFREPGGVLFESATDEPGFLADEPVEALGHGLQLPGWLEGDRPVIEQRLQPLHPPVQAGIQP
jgi:catechol 2,3-dioxygenase-like lactoylglutathione lyase family enzyme